MKLIETEWINFRNAVIAKDAGTTQLTEMRRAFFAGAWAFYSLTISALDPDAEVTGKDLALMRALDAELREFNNRVVKGWA
jgi:hypothetical protein